MWLAGHWRKAAWLWHARARALQQPCTGGPKFPAACPHLTSRLHSKRTVTDTYTVLCRMRLPQQVNYFNAKPEHVRDNRYLAARIELEDLLATEPEIVKQRREKLREVLLKVQTGLFCLPFPRLCLAGMFALCRSPCLLSYACELLSAVQQRV